MVCLNNNPVIVQTQRLPVVEQLESLFLSLEDTPLLTSLKGSTRRGPKGHPVETMWRCFLTKYALGLKSTVALIRTLQNNPYIAQACGVDTIPSEATFSRFFSKLTRRRYLHLVKDVSRAFVRRCHTELPGFGHRVAMDSTTLKAWSNGGKNPKADLDAGWSIKKGTQGPKEFVYGYKLHLTVDCEYELPIAANISAGDVHDSQRASNLLSEARKAYPKSPKYVLADQGYSGKPLFRLIRKQYRATPIIQVNKAHRHLMTEYKEEQQSAEWKAIYSQRQSVERAFSRLKGQRSLNHITVRKLKKVTLHCYLSLIAMQGLLISHMV